MVARTRGRGRRTHRSSIHHPPLSSATDFAAVRSRLPPLAGAVAVSRRMRHGDRRQPARRSGHRRRGDLVDHVDIAADARRRAARPRRPARRPRRPSPRRRLPRRRPPRRRSPRHRRPATAALTLAFTGDALWHSPAVAPGRTQLRRQRQRCRGHGLHADARPTAARRRRRRRRCLPPRDTDRPRRPVHHVPALRRAARRRRRRSPTPASTAARRPAITPSTAATAGIDRTVAVLEAHGLGQSGMARTPAEIAPQVFVADGFRVAHLSYTFGYNGLRLPPGEEWRSALIDPQRIIADATEARRLGAEVVIVSMHWGIEGRRDVTPEQRAVAEAGHRIGHRRLDRRPPRPRPPADRTDQRRVGHLRARQHDLQPAHRPALAGGVSGRGRCRRERSPRRPTARRSSPRRSSTRRGSIGSMAGTSTSCSNRSPTPPFPEVCAPSWRRRYAGPARCSAVFIAA